MDEIAPANVLFQDGRKELHSDNKNRGAETSNSSGANFSQFDGLDLYPESKVKLDITDGGTPIEISSCGGGEYVPSTVSHQVERVDDGLSYQSMEIPNSEHRIMAPCELTPVVELQGVEVKLEDIKDQMIEGISKSFEKDSHSGYPRDTEGKSEFSLHVRNTDNVEEHQVYGWQSKDTENETYYSIDQTADTMSAGNGGSVLEKYLDGKIDSEAEHNLRNTEDPLPSTVIFVNQTKGSERLPFANKDSAVKTDISVPSTVIYVNHTKGSKKSSMVNTDCVVKTDIVDSIQELPKDINKLCCDYCDKIFTDESSLVVHKMSHYTTSQLDGNQLDKHCDQTGCATEQTELPTPEKTFSCMYCGKGYAKKNILTQHIRIHTVEKRFPCPHCEKTFSRKYHLTEHIRTHTGEKPFGCAYCTKSFTYKSYLKEHYRIHTAEMRFPCPHCDSKFSKKSQLNSHIRLHTGGKPLICSYCSKRFSDKSKLAEHIRTHTGEKPFTCPYCDKRFTNKSHLTGHVRIHTGQRPYSCPHCSKTCRTKPHLNEHIKVHTGERPHSCTLCEKRFANKSGLTQHLRIHTGERPYRCHHCDRRFKLKNHLNDHLRIHTGDKPFPCSYCDKKFNRKRQLTEHMWIHPDKKPF